MIRLICPNLRCRKILAVPDDSRGKVIRCGQCASTVKVPESPRKPEKTGKPAGAET